MWDLSSQFPQTLPHNSPAIILTQKVKVQFPPLDFTGNDFLVNVDSGDKNTLWPTSFGLVGATSTFQFCKVNKSVLKWSRKLFCFSLKRTLVNVVVSFLSCDLTKGRRRTFCSPDNFLCLQMTYPTVWDRMVWRIWAVVFCINWLGQVCSQWRFIHSTDIIKDPVLTVRPEEAISTLFIYVTFACVIDLTMVSVWLIYHWYTNVEWYIWFLTWLHLLFVLVTLQWWKKWWNKNPIRTSACCDLYTQESA